MELAPNQVSINHVVSHGSLAQAQNSVDHWAFFHDGLVDRAAVAANDHRSEGFWVRWRAGELAVARFRALYSHVFTMHLAAAKHSINHETDDSSPLEHPVVRSTAEAMSGPEPMQVSSVLEWTWPEDISLKVGPTALGQIQRWWSDHSIPGCSRPVWMCGLQFFMDFVLSCGEYPPVFHDRKWRSGVDLTDLRRGQCSRGYEPRMIHRVHSFLRLLVMLGQGVGVMGQAKYTRCSSSAILHRFNCYYVGLDSQRLDRIDTVLMSVLGGQLSHPNQVEHLACVVGDPAWSIP